jgi:hypothetical protein
MVRQLSYFALLLLAAILALAAGIWTFLAVVGYVGVLLLIALPFLAYLALVLPVSYGLIRMFPPRGRQLLWSNLLLIVAALSGGVALGMSIG